MSRRGRKKRGPGPAVLSWADIRECLLTVLIFLSRGLCVLRYLNPVYYFYVWRQPHGRYILDKESQGVVKPSLWERMVHYFRSDATNRQKLMEWVQERLPDFGICTFTVCWSDGIALCALVESASPGACPRFDLLKPHHKVNNCRLALKLAHKYLGIPQTVVTPEEIALASSPECEEKIKRLVSLIRWASLQKKPERRSGGIESGLGYRLLRQGSIVRGAPDSCSAKGSGLVVGLVGKRCKFDIYTPIIELLDLQIEIAGPNNEYCNEKLTSSFPDGGNNRVLSKGNFSQGSRCSHLHNVWRSSAARVLNNNNSSAMRVIHSHNVDTEHQTDAEKIPFDYQCVGEGHFLISYIPRSEGQHDIDIRWHGKCIRGCPFQVIVADSIEKLNAESRNKMRQKKVSFDEDVPPKPRFYRSPSAIGGIVEEHEGVEDADVPSVTSAVLNRTSKVHRSISTTGKPCIVKQATITRRRVLRKVITQAGQEIVIHEAPSSPCPSREDSYGMSRQSSFGSFDISRQSSMESTLSRPESPIMVRKSRGSVPKQRNRSFDFEMVMEPYVASRSASPKATSSPPNISRKAAEKLAGDMVESLISDVFHLLQLKEVKAKLLTKETLEVPINTSPRENAKQTHITNNGVRVRKHSLTLQKIENMESISNIKPALLSPPLDGKKKRRRSTDLSSLSTKAKESLGVCIDDILPLIERDSKDKKAQQRSTIKPVDFLRDNTNSISYDENILNETSKLSSPSFDLSCSTSSEPGVIPLDHSNSLMTATNETCNKGTDTGHIKLGPRKSNPLVKTLQPYDMTNDHKKLCATKSNPSKLSTDTPTVTKQISLESVEVSRGKDFLKLPMTKLEAMTSGKIPFKMFSADSKDDIPIFDEIHPPHLTKRVSSEQNDDDKTSVVSVTVHTQYDSKESRHRARTERFKGRSWRDGGLKLDVISWKTIRNDSMNDFPSPNHTPLSKTNSDPPKMKQRKVTERSNTAPSSPSVAGRSSTAPNSPAVGGMRTNLLKQSTQDNSSVDKGRGPARRSSSLTSKDSFDSFNRLQHWSLSMESCDYPSSDASEADTTDRPWLWHLQKYHSHRLSSSLPTLSKNWTAFEIDPDDDTISIDEMEALSVAAQRRPKRATLGTSELRTSLAQYHDVDEDMLNYDESQPNSLHIPAHKSRQSAVSPFACSLSPRTPVTPSPTISPCGTSPVESRINSRRGSLVRQDVLQLTKVSEEDSYEEKQGSLDDMRIVIQKHFQGQVISRPTSPHPRFFEEDVERQSSAYSPYLYTTDRPDPPIRMHSAQKSNLKAPIPKIDKWTQVVYDEIKTETGWKRPTKCVRPRKQITRKVEDAPVQHFENGTTSRKTIVLPRIIYGHDMAMIGAAATQGKALVDQPKGRKYFRSGHASGSPTNSVNRHLHPNDVVDRLNQPQRQSTQDTIDSGIIGDETLPNYSRSPLVPRIALSAKPRFINGHRTVTRSRYRGRIALDPQLISGSPNEDKSGNPFTLLHRRNSMRLSRSRSDSLKTWKKSPSRQESQSTTEPEHKKGKIRLVSRLTGKRRVRFSRRVLMYRRSSSRSSRNSRSRDSRDAPSPSTSMSYKDTSMDNIQRSPDIESTKGMTSILNKPLFLGNHKLYEPDCSGESYDTMPSSESLNGVITPKVITNFSQDFSRGDIFGEKCAYEKVKPPSATLGSAEATGLWVEESMLSSQANQSSVPSTELVDVDSKPRLLGPPYLDDNVQAYIGQDPFGDNMSEGSLEVAKLTGYHFGEPDGFQKWLLNESPSSGGNCLELPRAQCSAPGSTVLQTFASVDDEVFAPGLSKIEETQDSWSVTDTTYSTHPVTPSIDTAGLPDPLRCRAFGGGLHFGQVEAKNNFTVSADTITSGALSVAVIGPRAHYVTETCVMYTGDNLYDVTYEVTHPGCYIISVKWGDFNIPSSPFLCKVVY